MKIYQFIKKIILAILKFFIAKNIKKEVQNFGSNAIRQVESFSNRYRKKIKIFEKMAKMPYKEIGFYVGDIVKRKTKLVFQNNEYIPLCNSTNQGLFQQSYLSTILDK